MSKVTTTKSTKSTKTVKVQQPDVVKEPETSTITEEVLETVLEPETTGEVESMKQRFEKLIKLKQEMITELKKEVVELRKMQRDHESALKEAMKKTKRKKVPREDGVPRKPSGFASPVIVSDELYSFLEKYGVKNGDPIARTDVTRHITAYIKEHDLQNPEARREIVPDTVLLNLFGPANELRDPNDPKSTKVYTYLKLQRYLSPHFPAKKTV